MQVYLGTLQIRIMCFLGETLLCCTCVDACGLLVCASLRCEIRRVVVKFECIYVCDFHKCRFIIYGLMLGLRPFIRETLPVLLQVCNWFNILPVWFVVDSRCVTC